MKYVVNSNASSGTDYMYSKKMKYGRRNYMVKYGQPDEYLGVDAQITEIHPYDDAEYAWVRIQYASAEFIQNGKQIDRVPIPTYADNDEFYEDIEEWLDDTFKQLISMLHDMNIDVQPKMVHN